MFPTLYLIALIAVAVMAPGATVYWDAFGYVLQAINGDVGGLGLGRPVFALAMHAIAGAWMSVGGSPWQIEMVLRVACAMLACLASPLTARLALDCGASRRAAWWSGLAVACSPAMAHAGGQVLTDGLGVTLLLSATVLGVRATFAPGPSLRRALGSGLALGLAVGVREQAIVSILALAWLVGLSPRRARARIAVAMAAGCLAAFVLPLAFVWATQPAYLDTVRAWLVSMGRDRTLKTYGWHDLGLYLLWILSLGPFVVVTGVVAIAVALRLRQWRWPLLVAVVVPALIQVAWMATFRGIAYSPRFLLSALPAAFAIPGSILIVRWAGDSRARRSVAMAAWVLPVLVAAPIAHARSAALTATLREWPVRLRSLPSDAVVVTGQPCPAIPLVRTILAHDPATRGDAPDWQPVCPGWSWPADLAGRLDGGMRDGRVAAADLRDASWTGAEQRAARDELDRYVRARATSVSSGRLIVWH